MFFAVIPLIITPWNPRTLIAAYLPRAAGSGRVEDKCGYQKEVNVAERVCVPIETLEAVTNPEGDVYPYCSSARQGQSII